MNPKLSNFEIRSIRFFLYENYMRLLQNESTSLLSSCLESASGAGEDTLMVPLLEDSSTFQSDFTFEFSDNTYR